MSSTTSKGGAEIEVGDEVTTKYRGGSHTGKVEEVITDKDQEINAKGKKTGPAVVFHDQNDKKVAHNPGTLTDVTKEET